MQRGAAGACPFGCYSPVGRLSVSVQLVIKKHTYQTRRVSEDTRRRGAWRCEVNYTHSNLIYPTDRVWTFTILRLDQKRTRTHAPAVPRRSHLVHLVPTHARTEPRGIPLLSPRRAPATSRTRPCARLPSPGPVGMVHAGGAHTPPPPPPLRSRDETKAPCQRQRSGRARPTRRL